MKKLVSVGFVMTGIALVGLFVLNSVRKYDRELELESEDDYYWEDIDESDTFQAYTPSGLEKGQTLVYPTFD